MKKILFIAVSIILLSTQAFSDTHYAASCSRADVATAVTAATAGDTVSIPSGSCTWTSGITLSTGITVQGAGSSTVITSSSSSIFSISGPGSGNFRISGMRFFGSSSSGQDINISGAWTSIRIDNIAWNTTSTRGILVGYNARDNILYYGTNIPHQKILIDNIAYSTSSTSAGHPFLLLYGRGHLAWLEPDGFGTDNFVFIEDSSFNFPSTAGYVTDTEHGGRIVFRYNTVTNGAFDTHDLGSTPGARGNRAIEFYENAFTCTASDCSNGSAYAVIQRGGTGIYYNNTISGYSLHTWTMIYRVAYSDSWVGGGYCADTDYRRVCQDVSKHCLGGSRANRPCYGDEDCPGSTCKNDRSCSSNSDCLDYDGNPGLCLQQLDGSAANGWPCRDQTGRGMDNATTGVQASSPVYWYSNTVNGSSYNFLAPSQYAAYIQVDRDFCNHSPATTCGSKAGWTYTPYTYPHPLQSGGSPPSDVTPPVLSDPSPSASVSCTSDPMTIVEQVSTDEFATVKWDTTDVSYDSMANTFTTTGGTVHSRTVSRACDATYTIYTRGMDASENKSTSSTQISYSIGVPMLQDETKVVKLSGGNHSITWGGTKKINLASVQTVDSITGTDLDDYSNDPSNAAFGDYSGSGFGTDTVLLDAITQTYVGAHGANMLVDIAYNTTGKRVIRFDYYHASDNWYDDDLSDAQMYVEIVRPDFTINTANWGYGRPVSSDYIRFHMRKLTTALVNVATSDDGTIVSQSLSGLATGGTDYNSYRLLIDWDNNQLSVWVNNVLKAENIAFSSSVKSGIGSSYKYIFHWHNYSMVSEKRYVRNIQIYSQE